jgi:hypothetical protein
MIIGVLFNMLTVCRKSRPFLLSLFTAVMLLNGKLVAVADDVCPELVKLETAAKTGFVSLRGTLDVSRSNAETQIFDPTYLLPNASHCEIDISKTAENKKSEYSCFWKVETPKKVAKQYESLSNDVKKCFSGARVEPWNEDALKISRIPGFKDMEIWVGGDSTPDPNVNISISISKPVVAKK